MNNAELLMMIQNYGLLMRDGDVDEPKKMFDEIRAALASKEASKAVPVADEPVVWIVERDGDSHLIRHSANFPGVFAGAEYKKTPLYLRPSQQALSDEEVMRLWDTRSGFPTEKYPLTDSDVLAFARAILAAAGGSQ